MYHKAYGIIETLAPLHVGASAGEETGNLNLIFRDQFTQTGIIPGSSIRGRFRADMRQKRQWWLEKQLKEKQIVIPNSRVQTVEVGEGEKKKTLSRLEWLELQAKEQKITVPDLINENYWYGHSSVAGQTDGGTTEALVKFEYASLVWLPVFCPGQPIVWVSCPRLLKRYQQITDISYPIPKPVDGQYPVKLNNHRNRLFFNLGFLDNLKSTPELSAWVPLNSRVKPENLVVVDDSDIATIHDMALYRQTRTKLEDGAKKVENFFGFEALPEDSILVFPIAIRQSVSKVDIENKIAWKPFKETTTDLYLGGLESIGCGRTSVMLSGEYFTATSGSNYSQSQSIGA
ncbi:MAG: type III-B CRISPR module RAMP protein Cmr4 [Trichocoleus desertorum ATA4-8-CV12]|jgi:CRISPR-associated protein Cmr4|nr:type III-B CRISPR module RAMP protein Cmr4 [Trichocoleus desertorum ATA4-8-CV12]